MGLDQYAYIARKPGTKYEDISRQRIAYWSKHPNLQGWMEKLYYEKGGKESFNGVELELTWEDIDRLEKDIKSGNVAKLGIKGYFFGDPKDDHYRKRDLQFCVAAKVELFFKRRLFYYSSW